MKTISTVIPALLMAALCSTIFALPGCSSDPVVTQPATASALPDSTPGHDSDDPQLDRPRPVKPDFRLRDLGPASQLPSPAQRPYQQCKNGHVRGCAALGYLFERGGRLDSATGLYDYGCANGDLSSCYRLAVILELGMGRDADPQRAYRFYDFVCSRGADPRACANLAMMYEKPRGVERDPKRTAELARRGCDLGGPRSCNNLAHYYRIGFGVERDLDRSLELYEQACIDGHRHACMRRGVTELTDSFCADARDYESCVMSLDTLNAAGPRVDELCGENPGYDKFLCMTYGLSLEYGCGHWLEGSAINADLDDCQREPDHDELARAAEVYEYWCERDSAYACNHLANLKRRGQAGYQTDSDAAIAAYEFACQSGFAVSCNDVGGMHMSRGAHERGAEWIAKACDINIEFCMSLDGICMAEAINSPACQR